MQAGKLATALGRAYAAFASYRFPQRLEGSPYKDLKGIYRELSKAPLHQLDAQDLGPYAGSALWTVGNLADYRHFLPRILELSVTRPEWMGFEARHIASKIQKKHWRAWPEEERAAIEAVFLAAWERCLDRHPDVFDLGNWLEGIAILELDVAGTLKLWSDAVSPRAMLGCADVIVAQRESLVKARVLDWPEVSPAVVDQVVTWLLSERIERRLANLALSGDLGDFDKWQVLEAIEIVGSLRA